MSRRINRVATVSVHTSPLDQPGTGDAGGMNVYIVEVAKRLAARSVEVDIFTRATCCAMPPVVELAPGVLVRNIVAGPFEELDKTELPRHLCGFTSGVLRVEAAHDPGHYDLLHTHYWLSGQAGWAAKQRWGVPLVHSMHTMAKVKNAALADGDKAEPAERVLGEEQVVASSDQLVANTAKEADELVDLYGADPSRVATVSPGVDLSVFHPESSLHTEASLLAHGASLLSHGRVHTPRNGMVHGGGATPHTPRNGMVHGGGATPHTPRNGMARRRLGLPPNAYVLLFVGRIQPLKAPDVLLRAVARMLADDPSLRSELVVAVVGGLSGFGRCRPEGLQHLAAELGISDVMRFEPPTPQAELADWYRAADVTVVPSHSESFGLVAVESQACGTPVVASRVGGLCTAVADGESGILISGHDPADYAAVLRRLYNEPRLHARLSRGAVRHGRSFGWDATVDNLLDVYTGAMSIPAVRVATPAEVSA